MHRLGSARWRRYGLFAVALGLVLFGCAPAAEARIRNIILDPPTPFPSPVGSPYMMIEGVAIGEIDPHDPLNKVIQDIQLAPLESKNRVQYSTKIFILMPVDLSASNHTMLLNIVNRGNLQIYDVGNDQFELKQGFIPVKVGWQADLLPINNPFFFPMSAPVAHERNGGTITGVVRSEFTLSAPASTQNIVAGTSTNTPGYPTVSLDNRHDIMTMRVHQEDPKVPIPNTDWAYADCTTVPFPGVPNAQKVCLRNGFDTDHIYELVYTARDPIVMGLGLAAIRDVGSFLRYEEKDDLGNPNPLAGAMKYALLWGSSQGGKVLRTYLRLGFNEDEAHRQIFDGMQPEGSTGRSPVNIRFSQPGRGGSQHTEAQYPGGESPRSYGDILDPVSGIRGGLLDRCRRTRTCPKIVHTMSDNEYWEGSGAFVTADALGRFDLGLPENVRIYQFASTQHSGFSPIAPLPTSTGICQFLPNPNPYAYHLRALLMALQQWVAFGTPPPPSMYSRIDRKTLVPLAGFRFPPTPLLRNPEPQAIFKRRQLFDRGPHYDPDDVSGIISIEPPDLLADYPAALVPQVDADGNGIDGVRTLTLQVPLGTYMGWNIRRAGFSEGDACDMFGSYMPFAITKAQRGSTADPRASLEERYGTLSNYTALATAAAKKLVAQRLLLPSDVDAAIQSATNQAQQAGLK